MSEKGRKPYALIYLNLALLMVGLGTSDALRGIFAPEFRQHFQLDASGVSLIVTVSYTGNLVFLLAGTRLADRFGRRKVFNASLLLWMGALVLYIVTDSFWALLAGMFFAMGASTLLNTLMNLMAPLIFAAPGLVVNTLFFAQGIGTSAGQGVIGNLMADFTGWKMVNAMLLGIGIATAVLLRFWKLPETSANGSGDKKEARGKIVRPAFWWLFFAFGFYFVAEHGILNWLVLYCEEGLGISSGRASVYLAMFFGGMTAGRLIFAPLEQRLGTIRSIRVFGTTGAAFYVLSLISGKELPLLFLGGAGLFLSVVYPTLVLAVQSFFEEQTAASATGAVISAATIFDIGFNLIFGKIIDSMGYRTGFLILPVSIVIFLIVFYVFTDKSKQTRRI